MMIEFAFKFLKIIIYKKVRTGREIHSQEVLEKKYQNKPYGYAQ